MPYKTEFIPKGQDLLGARIVTGFERPISPEDLMMSIEVAITLLDGVNQPLPVIALVESNLTTASKALLKLKNRERIRILDNHPNKREFIMVGNGADISLAVLLGILRLTPLGRLLSVTAIRNMADYEKYLLDKKEQEDVVVKLNASEDSAEESSA